MSEEHKALGFRPPHGSLAAEAQAAAAKHPEVTGVQKPTLEKLKAAARLDATRILCVHLIIGVERKIELFFDFQGREVHRGRSIFRNTSCRNNVIAQDISCTRDRPKRYQCGYFVPCFVTFTKRLITPM